ncbi:MAG: hypothetical protein Q4D38_01900 [Planctomycetia bacterium]|nr:hypothetical protein [Planctomycetia bacterium]
MFASIAMTKDRILKNQPRLSLGLALVFLASVSPGCTSNPFTEGAYIGCDTQSPYVEPDQPRHHPSTSVPIFASRNVKSDARNRAAIEQYTGRPVLARPVTTDDVLAWRQAGAPDQNVITHIRTHGCAQPLTPQEVLTLQQRGVSNNVIRSMQEHPYPKVGAPTPPSSGNFPRSGYSNANSNPNTNPGTFYAAPTQASTPRASTTLAPPAPAPGAKPRVRIADGAPQVGSQVVFPNEAYDIYPDSYSIPAQNGTFYSDDVFIMDGCCY